MHAQTHTRFMRQTAMVELAAASTDSAADCQHTMMLSTFGMIAGWRLSGSRATLSSVSLGRIDRFGVRREKKKKNGKQPDRHCFSELAFVLSVLYLCP